MPAVQCDMAELTSLDARIAKAVERGRLIWALVMIGATVFTLTVFPFWYALFLIPFGVVSYFAMLFMTFMVLRETVSAVDMELEERETKLQEIQARIDSEGLCGEALLEVLHEAGMAEMAPVKAMSEEIIGHIDGHAMHEWVEMLDPTTGKVERFAYFGIATYDPHGIPLLPEEKGKVYAHVDGVVYARDFQPV